MDAWAGAAILAAGAAAGAINAAVGSGTLITFPVLLGLGYPPTVANISNNLGLVPGSITAALGYRREIVAPGRSMVLLGLCSATGSAGGALALLVLPSSAFEAIVPALVALAVLLVLVQPALARRARSPRPGRGVRRGWLGRSGWPVRPELAAAIGLAGVYGGYFGAAQGVLLIGILGWLFTPDLQQANGVKNGLSAIVNAVAALVFVMAAGDRVEWAVVLLIAAGSTLGGFAGAALGRRLPARVLRGVIAVVGVVAIVRLLA